MKNIYLILGVFTMLFSACETDFDVNAEWEETTVVFGLLDASDENQLQKIKISKAFLGNMDAYQMAQYSDSINYSIDELDVKIYKWDFNQIEDSVELIAVPTYRDGEIFYDSIIVYQFDNVNSFLQKGYEYELVVENMNTGNLVTSKSEVLTNFSFDNFNAAQYQFGFVSPNGEFSSKTMSWGKPTNGQVYQLDFHFYYSEDGDTMSLVWSQPLADNQDRTTILEGDKFFNFLSNKIPDDSKVRKFLNVELVMTVGSEDLYTYTKVNEPITGIVQQRPQFTNINNGIGLFSSRYTHSEVLESGGGLSGFTKDYIRDELNRNFQ